MRAAWFLHPTKRRGRGMKDRCHDEAMAELFQADSSYATELLAEVCADGCADELYVLICQLSTCVLKGMVAGDTGDQD